jgi:hypothetical protein
MEEASLPILLGKLLFTNFIGRDELGTQHNGQVQAHSIALMYFVNDHDAS